MKVDLTELENLVAMTVIPAADKTDQRPMIAIGILTSLQRPQRQLLQQLGRHVLLHPQTRQLA